MEVIHVKSFSISNYLILSLMIAILSGCQSPEKPVADPTGWKAHAFEGEIRGDNYSEHIYVDEEKFEVSRKAVVRGLTMRTIIEGDSQRVSTRVIWLLPNGQEHQDPPIEGDKASTRRLLEDYKTRYLKIIENNREILEEGAKQTISFCGREAYQVSRGRELVVVDALTGIILARYRAVTGSAPQLDRQLVYARWRLQRSRERGYYEIQCRQ